MIVVKNRFELIDRVQDEIATKGPNCDLNHLDVSSIENFDGVFHIFNGSFNGNISKWNISNAKSMSHMFDSNIFNGDVSKWDTSNVINMEFLFIGSKFNNDISQWNTSSVVNMNNIFQKSSFCGDVSRWNTKKLIYFSQPYSKIDLTNCHINCLHWLCRITQCAEIKWSSEHESFFKKHYNILSQLYDEPTIIAKNLDNIWNGKLEPIFQVEYHG